MIYSFERVARITTELKQVLDRSMVERDEVCMDIWGSAPVARWSLLDGEASFQGHGRRARGGLAALRRRAVGRAGASRLVPAGRRRARGLRRLAGQAAPDDRGRGRLGRGQPPAADL